MAVRVKLPEISMGVTEVTIINWLKKVGDSVAFGEPIVEVETAKSTMEVEAPAAGRLSQIKVKAGEEVEVGAEIAIIEKE